VFNLITQTLTQNRKDKTGLAHSLKLILTEKNIPKKSTSATFYSYPALPLTGGEI